MHIWIALLLGILEFSSSFAVETPMQNPLTLDVALVAVLENNPTLLAGDYQAQAAAAKIRQAQQSTPVNVKLELENFAGSGRFSGDDLLEATLSLGKVLELGDKAGLRGNIARNEAALLGNEQDAERLDLLAEAARRFIHVVVDQERLKIARDRLALAKRTAAIVDKRVRVGKSPDTERRRTRIAVARAETELEHAEHELATSRLKLATQWGKTEAGFSSARASLFALNPPGSFDELAQLLERNPDLTRYASEQRLAEARLRLAQSRRRMDIGLSGGVRYHNVTDDSALVLSASIPFGTRSRAAPGIESSRLLSDRHPLLYKQRQLELHASLFEIYQELSHAYSASQTLREQIVPEAELVLRDYETGYRSGRYSLLELSDAQKTLLDARLESVMTAADFHNFRIEIERLTGQALSTGAPQ
ncbi:MAG: TolC family protein [Pseudomonadota bacterium]|nr:TolC family protein [Pseudomonadota bacterium]